jgi:cell division septation protein DedD
MMKLVNHASEEIHRVYQRLVGADVCEELNAIRFPTAAVPAPQPSYDAEIADLPRVEAPTQWQIGPLSPATSPHTQKPNAHGSRRQSKACLLCGLA